jgi:cellulose synthase/poly-beta-1,6-N-acetylglucosamine synthase-like glycosyltransferase
MTFLIVITLIALFIPVYVYIGYPLLLIVLDKLIKGKKLDISNITPTVSLIVSCYNEADVIEQKIQNCQSLDYPGHRLEIIFVSDGSDDGTDELIKPYCNENIKLIRQEGRLGKTMGLNLALAEASGEIVVFSDANAMYKEDALKMLVRNFNDASVGYVVGAAIYQDDEQSAAGSSENIYWQYEIFIKKIESKLHSVVGGDGAIYAIRKSLYEPLDQEDINDFVNPLQIIAKGYRGIFDAEAICYEQTAGDFDKEGKRKQRIVNRSFSGLMKNKTVLNPFKHGFYSLELLSHKLLRWLIPFFILVAAVGITVLAQMKVELFQWMLLLGIIFVWFVLLGRLLKDSEEFPSVLLIPYYFYLVNFNSMKGVLQSLRGDIQITWSTPRDQQTHTTGMKLGSVLAFIGLILITGGFFWITLQSLFKT